MMIFFSYIRLSFYFIFFIFAISCYSLSFSFLLLFLVMFFFFFFFSFFFIFFFFFFFSFFFIFFFFFFLLFLFLILNPFLSHIHYSLPQLNATSDVSLYNELMDVRKYKEYIIFSIIACPLLLLDWGIFDIFESFDLHLLVVPVFRDLVSTCAQHVHVCVCVCVCTYVRVYVYMHMYLFLDCDFFIVLNCFPF